MPSDGPRIDYQTFTRLAPDAYAGLAALGKAVDDAGLDKELTELVKLRVSQINGCAFCIQFHLNVARKIGVEAAKLDLIAAWRDAGVFSQREMAALAWAEALTVLGTEVPNEAWVTLLEQFSDSEALFLTIAIGTINNWNRLGVALRFAPPVPRKAVAQ